MAAAKALYPEWSRRVGKEIRPPPKNAVHIARAKTNTTLRGSMYHQSPGLTPTPILLTPRTHVTLMMTLVTTKYSRPLVTHHARLLVTTYALSAEVVDIGLL